MSHLLAMYPLAYLLTWRSYGTWLPGDERGFTNTLHNTFGTPYAPSNGLREELSVSIMKGAAFVLCDRAREIAEGAIRDHCKHKSWGLRALNVRTNHVHAVVACGRFNPDLAIGQFKQWSKTRILAAGLGGDAGDIWARKGSKRFLWDDQDVLDAINYVEHGQ